MFRFLRLAIMLASLIGLNPVAANDAVAVKDANAEAIAMAASRGEQLYKFDQAGWHVTDAMQEDFDNPEAAGMRGYVITPDVKGTRVTFYGERDGTPYGIYTAVWERGDGKIHIKQADGKPFGLKELPIVTGRKTLRGKEEQQLSPDQLRLITARQVVLDSLGADNKGFVGRCTDARMNIAVLPRSSPESPDLVYLTSAQVDLDEYPLGGHYRFEVRNGQIENRRAFTKGCLNLSTKNDDRKYVEALYLSHTLDPIPTEIHVFTMLSAQLPIFVATTQNGIVWSLTEPEGEPVIEPIDKSAQSDPKAAN